jgi:glutamate racemase
MGQANRRAIGIFDSGVGGLTVLKALMARLPHESTTYLGDTARVPYGTKSAEVVTRYSVKNGEFLLNKQVKLLVVACNTASAVALPQMSAALKIPVLGVIEPGARAASRITRSGRVGVIGTPGTIHSGAYQRALQEHNSKVSVIAKACPLFVPLAEEGWVEGEVPRLVAREYLSELRNSGVDTLVLGCTHYPLLKGVISEALGNEVRLVDSAEATADAVAELLASHELLAPAQHSAQHEYFVTDVPHRFLQVGARFLGRPIPHAEQVDITFA